MHSSLHLWTLLLGLLLGVGAVGPPVRAQNNRFTDRSFVASPVVLGMGDAGVALAGPDHAFFYNPAHLPAVDSRFTIFGVQASATRSLDDHIRFFNRQAAPVVEAGDQRSAEALAELRRTATGLRRRPSRGAGDILLPSFVYTPGAFSIGGGLFTKTAVNYRLEAGVGRAATAWMLSRTDLMALVSVGLDLRVLGLPGLSVGATGTETRRFLAFKNKPLARFEPTERPVRLEGGTFQVDLGATYTPGWGDAVPGTVRLGGAVYDILPGNYDYNTGGVGRLPFLDDIVDSPNGDSLGPAAAEVDRARSLFALRPSYRVGAAYQLPRFFALEGVGVAADYQGYLGAEQDLLTRVHLGARATVLEGIELRAGLSSGYPSGGLGVEVGALHLDYSLHGVEDGGRGAYVHTARLLLRLE